MNLSRRRFATLAAAAVGASALAACGDDGNGTDTPTQNGDGGDNGNGGAAGAFTYWSMWTEGEDQQVVLSEEIAKFTEATGIEVDVQWSGREVLGQVVPRLNAGNPPDLVDMGAPDFLAQLGAENLTDLSDVYDMEIPDEGGTVRDVIPESLMGTMELEGGGTFLVPYEIIGSTMWYNANVTPELGDSTPQTWEDFVALMQQLRDDGRTPIALDGDIADYCAYWVEWGVLRAGGAGSIREAMQDATGEAFNNPAWTAATDNVEALITGGFFPEGFNGTTFPTQQASWADQTSETDVILMGSWLPSETTASITQSGGDPESLAFGSFPFPSVGENLGAGLAQAQPIGFAVPNGARNIDPAKQFMAWFMHKDRIQRIATDTKNLTPRTDVEPPAELADFAEEYANAEETILMSDGITLVDPAWVTDIWQPAIRDFFGGNLSAQEFRDQLAEQTSSHLA